MMTFDIVTPRRDPIDLVVALIRETDRWDTGRDLIAEAAEARRNRQMEEESR